jgi:WD40 repeat protein
VVLLKDSVHHEVHRRGASVLNDAPRGFKNFDDLWLDPRDPLLYVDSGYGLFVYHLWTGDLLRTFDSGRSDQRYLDAVRDPDGRLVLLLEDEDGVRVWSPPDPPGSRLELEAGAAVSLSGDGTWVAIGGPKGVEVRAAANQELLAEFSTKGPVVKVAAAGDGDHLAVGLESGALQVFDTSKLSAPFPTDRPVTEVDTGRIRTTSLLAAPPARRIPERSIAMPGSTTQLTWAPNGRVAGWVGSKFVELDPSGTQFDPAVPLLPGKPFAYSRDGSVLAGVTATGVALVDTRNPKRWKVLKEIPTGGAHQQLQWAGPTLVVDAGSGKAQAWDPVKQVAFGEPFSTSPDVTAKFVQSPDGAMLAVSGRLPALLDARTGLRLSDLPGHVGGVVAVAWSSDGTHLATAGVDGAILVWDPATLTPVVMADGAAGTRLVFSPDGAKVLSGSFDGGVVFDTQTGALLEHLLFDGQLEAVAWSTAGRMRADNAGNAFFWAP